MHYFFSIALNRFSKVYPIILLVGVYNGLIPICPHLSAWFLFWICTLMADFVYCWENVSSAVEKCCRMSLEPRKECSRQHTRREENICLNILCCKTKIGLDPNPTHVHVSILLLLCIVNLFNTGRPPAIYSPLDKGVQHLSCVPLFMSARNEAGIKGTTGFIKVQKSTKATIDLVTIRGNDWGHAAQLGLVYKKLSTVLIFEQKDTIAIDFK